MTRQTEMSPTRRRPIPGMAQSTAAPDAPAAVPSAASPPRQRASKRSAQQRRGSARAEAPADATPARRPAADYSTTRLVNFRLPADLHDRFKQLVRETEEAHPRLRHPSLTELVIALLEEGPTSPDEVAELIRRKRAAEHEPSA